MSYHPCCLRCSKPLIKFVPFEGNNVNAIFYLISSYLPLPCHVSQICSSFIAIAFKRTLMSNEPLPDMRCRWTNGLSLRYSLETGRTSIHCPPNVLPHGLYDDYKALLPYFSKNIGVVSRSELMDKTANLKEAGYHWEGNMINSINHSSTSSSSTFSSNIFSGSLETEASTDPNPIPDAFKIYVELAQKALKRCLKEDAVMSRAFQSRTTSQHKSLHDNSTLCGAVQLNRKTAGVTPYSSCHCLPRVFVDHL